METLLLTGSSLTLEDVVAVARYKSKQVAVSAEQLERVASARRFVDTLVQNKGVAYGVNTGFGSLKNIVISPEYTAQLQANLIRSHSVGVGDPYDEEIVRAAILIRINSLIHGHSGIRLETVTALLALLNNDVYPFVPSKGSVGASGDLAPLSHLVLVLMGEGECMADGKRIPSMQELRRIGLLPLTLEAKEGLALNNGTSFMAAVMALAMHDSLQLQKVADISAAMTLEVLMGSIVACHESIHALRPHPGQLQSAQNIRALTQGSQIIESHKDCCRVQDAYSLRCTPQVHGACRDAIAYAHSVIEREINAVTDNPLLFPDENIVRSGGNFHGEPLAIGCDVLAIALAEFGSIAERRIARLMDMSTSEGLPAFLIPAPHVGLSSGFMITQYTAAALVSENKVLAHPASVDSIPTCANQEDHVSMGSIAARKAREVLKNVQNILAIELLCASQATDYRLPLVLGRGTRNAYDQIRERVRPLQKDRVLSNDIALLQRMLFSPAFLNRIQEITGQLE